MSITDARTAARQAGVNLVEYDEKTEVPNSTLAMTDAEALNKLAFSSMAPDWVKDQLQGQDGMTDEERAEYEREEKLREEQLQADIQAQWQRTADQYDEMLDRIHDAQRKNDEANRKLDERALHLSDGTKVFKRGDKWVTINEETGEETEVTDPQAIEDLKRQEEALNAQGKAAADADTKQKVIAQGQELNAAEHQASAQGADAHAHAEGTTSDPGNPQDQKARAGEAQGSAGALGSRVDQLIKDVDSTTARVDSKFNGLQSDYRNVGDNDFSEFDSRPHGSVKPSIGGTGSAASVIDPMSSPDKGKAVSAFAASASPTPSEPAPAATVKKDQSFNNNAGVGSPAPG